MTNKNLILTRKVGDRIVLHTGSGEPLCTITVTNIAQKACKLAFQANDSVRIDREEIYSKKGDKNENSVFKSKETIS